MGQYVYIPWVNIVYTMGQYVYIPWVNMYTYHGSICIYIPWVKTSR